MSSRAISNTSVTNLGVKIEKVFDQWGRGEISIVSGYARSLTFTTKAVFDLAKVIYSLALFVFSRKQENLSYLKESAKELARSIKNIGVGIVEAIPLVGSSLIHDKGLSVETRKKAQEQMKIIYCAAQAERAKQGVPILGDLLKAASVKHGWGRKTS